MVTNCCLKGCKNESYPGCPVTFHSFPKDPVRRQIWLRNVKLKGNFYNSAKICSFHFKPEDYEKGRISKTAVPFYPELGDLEPPILGDCMSSPTPDDEKSINDATDCESIEYLQIDLQESEDEKVMIEDHSPMPPVCRVCLTTNLKMLTISGQLIKTYEMMTNTKLDTDEGMPDTICFYCHSELQKCSRFSSTARKSERVLRNCSNSKGILSFPDDLKGQVKKRNLCVTKQEPISVDGDVDKGTKSMILQQLINQAQLPEKRPMLPVRQTMLPVKQTPLPIKLKLADHKISTTLAKNKKIKSETENVQVNINSQEKHTDDFKNTKNNIKIETDSDNNHAKMDVDNTKLEYAESDKTKTEHEQVKTYKKRTSFCKICNKIVPRTIREHNIRNHVMKKHVCEKCGFACKAKKIMVAHEKIHSNKCNIGWFSITDSD